MLDIIFLSYDEPNCEENWQRLKQRFPHARRVHGVKGILEAHRECARIANTENFFVVDGDAYILDDFDSDDLPLGYSHDCVYAWRSINAVNDLVYGNGGVKLVPKLAFDKVKVKNIDIMKNIGKEYKQVPKIASVTRFNASPFTAWRAGFRECVNLESHVCIGKQERGRLYCLNVWCNVGVHRPFGKWCIKGAREGRRYVVRYKDNWQALNLINDFDWLYEQFKRVRNTNSLLHISYAR